MSTRELNLTIRKLNLMVQGISHGMKYSLPSKKDHICFYPTTGTVVVAYKGKPHVSFKSNKTEGINVAIRELKLMFENADLATLDDLLILGTKYPEKVKIKVKQESLANKNRITISVDLNDVNIYKSTVAIINKHNLINEAYKTLYNALNSSLPF